jgi:hypothetical protein
MGTICFVYIIGTTAEAYKIGVAGNPRARHNSLKTGIPDPSTLLHSIQCPSRARALKLEKSLHERLAKYHTIGEWFKPPRNIIDSIILETRTSNAKRGALAPKETQTHEEALITHGDFSDWPLIKMKYPPKEELLQIIHRVSNVCRRRPTRECIQKWASWRGMSPTQVDSIISELVSERTIIEIHPGLYRFP